MSTTGVQSSQSSGPRSTPQSGPFQTLSSSQLAALSLGVTSSLLPSPAELVGISQALTALGASATNLTPLSLEIVNYLSLIHI